MKTSQIVIEEDTKIHKSIVTIDLTLSPPSTPIKIEDEITVDLTEFNFKRAVTSTGGTRVSATLMIKEEGCQLSSGFIYFCCAHNLDHLVTDGSRILGLGVLESREWQYLLGNLICMLLLLGSILKESFLLCLMLEPTNQKLLENPLSTIIASCRTDRSGLIEAAPWIRVPYPFQWGAPSFDAGEAFVMMMGSFVALVESTGGFMAVSRYASATPLPPSILSRGVGWQEVGILLSGLFGTGTGSSGQGLMPASFKIKLFHLMIQKLRKY